MAKSQNGRLATWLLKTFHMSAWCVFDIIPCFWDPCCCTHVSASLYWAQCHPIQSCLTIPSVLLLPLSSTLPPCSTLIIIPRKRVSGLEAITLQLLFNKSVNLYLHSTPLLLLLEPHRLSRSLNSFAIRMSMRLHSYPCPLLFVRKSLLWRRLSSLFRHSSLMAALVPFFHIVSWYRPAIVLHGNHFVLDPRVLWYSCLK